MSSGFGSQLRIFEAFLVRLHLRVMMGSVLVSFVCLSIGHKPESLGKRDSQLRKRTHRSGLSGCLDDIFLMANGRGSRPRPLWAGPLQARRAWAV